MRTQMHCRRRRKETLINSLASFGLLPHKRLIRVSLRRLLQYQDRRSSAILSVRLVGCIGVAALSLLAGCSKPKHPAPSSAAFSDLNPAVAARFQSMTNPVEA